MENKEVKYNDSTKLRPEGERILDAPLVHMDLKGYIKKIKSEKSWDEKKINSITLYKTEGMRIVLLALHKNAVLEKHTANGTISVHVLDGEIQFATADQSVTLTENEMVTLHKKIPHEVTAVKESVFLLTVCWQGSSER